MTAAPVAATVPVSAWLAELLADATGRPVGESEPPRSATPPYDVAADPYLIITTIPGGYYTSPGLAPPGSCGWQVWQVDSVGRTRLQAQMLADRARAAILARVPGGDYVNDPTASGFAVSGRIQSSEGGGSPIAEGDWPNQVWSSAERFELYIETGD